MQENTAPAKIETIDGETALKNFMMDIQCLDALTKWSSRFNLFDVLKISDTEIRHSNTLAWLLSPTENHGLGDALLRRLIQKVGSRLTGQDIFDVLLMDLYDCTVLREWNHIDILIISHAEKFLLCIENKVFSGEHDEQLKTYRTLLEAEYPDYRRLYAFLTPDGIPPESEEDADLWETVSYADILEMLEQVCQSRDLAPDIAFFIRQYIETVRRNIVEDKELTELCQKIYAKHRQALDLIYEHRMDPVMEVSSLVQEWCEEKAKTGAIGFSRENSSKAYTRFTTPFMDELLPRHDQPVSGWHSSCMYFYEVCSTPGRIGVVLTVCSDNLTLVQREHFDRLVQQLNMNTKENWRWKRLFNTGQKKMKNEMQLDEMQPDELRRGVWSVMDSYWKKVQGFEEDLGQKLAAAPAE